MNEIICFFQEMFGDTSKGQRPVGLTGFKTAPSKEITIKKTVSKNDVRLSDLMRRTH